MKSSHKKRSLLSVKFLFGSAFLLIGIFLLTNSNSLTGFIISSNENLINYTPIFIGIILVITGLFFIFFVSRQEMKKPTSGLNPDGVYALTQVQKNKNIGIVN